MPLPFLSKKPKLDSREYLFALEIDHGRVKSAVWSVINNRTQVLSISTPVNWDDTTDDSLVSACDQSLSDAAARLDAAGKIQPEKVILGLPSDWLAQEKIAPVRLKSLKYLSHKLSLKAVGFVVTPEAMVRFQQHTEGVPLTAIMLGIWTSLLEMTLVRLGKTDRIHLIKRSSAIVSDVVEGLSRYSHVDMLPSRILLYDSGLDLEEIRQQLLAHPWKAPQTRLPFLHFPKIEILPSDFSIVAIALAGGTEVAQAIGLMSPVPDILPEIEPQEIVQPEAGVDLGFVAEQDVAQFSPPPVIEPVAPPISPALKKLAVRRFPKISLRAIAFPGLRLPRFSVGGKPLLIFLIAVLLLAGLFGGYWYLPSSTVTLTVDKRILEHQFELVADTDAGEAGGDTGVFPAVYSETSVSDQSSVPTTGSKLVGDKASGSVSVINGTSVPRSFPSGTAITSPSGLKFMFDSDIQIASASGTADPNSYQPGKGTVKVTAAQIGTDSTLSAGTQFKIGTFSTLDFVAKNEEAFSGGSSRQAQVVSKDDISKLRQSLSASLRERAREDLVSRASDDENVIPESISLETESEDFSHKLDAEAAELNLKLEVKATGLVISNSELNSLVAEQIQSRIPEGFTQSGDISYTFDVKEAGKQKVALTVNVSAPLLPRLDNSQIIRDLTGKSPGQAKDYLAGLPGVLQVEFTFSPRMPSGLLTLPHVSSKINLVVTPAP